MSIFRQSLLQSYKTATQHWRQAIREDLLQRRQMPAAILFYHRVADTSPNDWSISQRDFERHLDWLKENCEFASLAEIQSTQQFGLRNKMQLCVTFDDGYAENCDWALPELLNRQIPTAYFVTTSNVAEQNSFSHDVRNGKDLAVNSVSQIRDFANRGIEIGSHTQTHLDLGLPHRREVLVAEIRDSRSQLQDWTGQSIDYFAFPYGLPENISQAAIDMVYEAGYKGFVSAYGGWNWPGEDDFHLQRIHGDPGLASLTNWLTFDPRKMRRGSRVRYQKSVPIAASDLRELVGSNG